MHVMRFAKFRVLVFSSSQSTMSDEEHTFESADAGASHFVPESAGSIRKGMHVMLKDKPCKIVDIATAKPGKHGSSKCAFTGIDIFTGKKVEEIYSSHASCNMPIVVKTEYTVLDANGEDQTLSLLTADGNTKDDLTLPTDNDGLDENARKILDLFENGKGIVVIVQSACGIEKVVGYREEN